MKKLSLTLDQLKVDTFVAGPATESPGTVRGNGIVDPLEADEVAITAPAPKPVSWDTQCATICFTCDRMSPSNATGCYTGNAPNCCV